MSCGCECCKTKYRVIQHIWLDNDYKLEPGTIISDEIIEQIKDTVRFSIWLNEGWICPEFSFLEDCRNNAQEVLDNDSKYNDIHSNENEILKCTIDYIRSQRKHCQHSQNPNLVYEDLEESEKYLLGLYMDKELGEYCDG